jgi:heme A synthase
MRAEASSRDVARRSRFAHWAWITVALTIAVILWGAWVRATGSGAGCGSHWPLCNGAVVPPSPGAATRIEFIHRASSGLTLIAVLMLLFTAWRVYPPRHIVRWMASAAGALILVEAAIGAGLVVFELVAGDTSMSRAIIGALHLANTYLLLAALTLAAVFGGQPGAPKWEGTRRLVGLGAISLGGLMLVGMTGAVTALGDTLFRPATLAAGIAQELDPAAHLMVRMRLFHPAVAVLAGLATAYFALALCERDIAAPARRMAVLLGGLLIVQLLAGAVNVALLAPLWLQIIHLLLSDLIWVLLIALCGRALTSTQ